MNLAINDQYSITDIKDGDQPAFIEHLQVKQIYDQTANVPYPYTEKEANEWIGIVAEETRKQGRSVIWAIRKKDGALIGCIGFHGFNLGKSHRAEIGYWLAKPYWGSGIMTEAVKKVCKVGFEEFGLVKITAHVFDFNAGSARVAEKAGFMLEATLRMHYKKDGKIFDCKAYAKFADGSR